MSQGLPYYVIGEPCEYTLIVSKSRFITTLMPISDYDDAIIKAKQIAKKYSDATHNCYAFICNDTATQVKFCDDGEPQGTAGLPMLEVLKKRNVYLTLAVVTRYFGGIKLGAGGLVSVYSTSVAQALDNANLLYMQEGFCVQVDCDYNFYKKLEELIAKNNAKVQSVEFSEGAKVVFIVPINDWDKLNKDIIDLSLGKAKINVINKQYYGF